MKANTTSAANFVGGFPNVFSPRIKELHHFSTDLHRHRHSMMRQTVHSFANTLCIQERSKYIEFYSAAKATDKYSLDASTSYLYSSDAAAGIREYSPNAKIVILLRDPVARAWSEFLMNKAIGLERQDFRGAIDRELVEMKQNRTFLLKRYLLAGMYGEQVTRYFNEFPPENIFVDVVDRPGDGLETVLGRLSSFLGLALEGPIAIPRENEARAPFNNTLNSALYWTGIKAAVSRIAPVKVKRPVKRIFYRQYHRQIEESDARYIYSVFEESNNILQTLYGIDVSHWSKSSSAKTFSQGANVV